ERVGPSHRRDGGETPGPEGVCLGADKPGAGVLLLPGLARRGIPEGNAAGLLRSARLRFLYRLRLPRLPAAEVPDPPAAGPQRRYAPEPLRRGVQDTGTRLFDPAPEGRRNHRPVRPEEKAPAQAPGRGRSVLRRGVYGRGTVRGRTGVSEAVREVPGQA